MSGSSSQAPELLPEFLAAGTDLLERRRSGIAKGPVTALRAKPGEAAIYWNVDGSARLGAAGTIATLATNARLGQGYPGLVAAAASLATPQIRSVATLGGNLAQRTRCWYFRNPHLACLKKGGASCPARVGNHLYGIIFDTGPCVAPHPSTLGAALLAYDARVTTTLRADVPVSDIFGDGRDGTRDHTLAAGEAITTVSLPSPMPGEIAFYDRTISRSAAEWPLVEAVVRIVLDGDHVRVARVAVGGVAPVPLRLPEVERALEGHALDEAVIGAAARLAVADARPLRQSAYKVSLLQQLVHDLLVRAQSTKR
jgi:xanthine dehydrogenase YagS FAD-binding subunit